MLHELLAIPMDEKRIVSIYGAGGKTSLLYALARESKGIEKTSIFTTTNIFIPDEKDIVLLNPFSENRAYDIWSQSQIVCAGCPITDTNKLGPPDVSVQNWLVEQSGALYVEADGSKRMPLKYPAAWEPVPAESTTHTVVVAGLSALDQPRLSVVHRAALAEERMAYSEPVVTEEGLAKLMWAGYGRFDPIIMLNQADTAELDERGQRVAEYLISYGARRVVVLSMKNLCGQ